jgi:hypothetical protein
MEIPEYLHDRVLEVINMQSEGADRARLWSTVYRLAPFRDGNAWCVMLGPNIHDGISGFGRTPEEALRNFEIAMGQGGGQAGNHLRLPIEPPQEGGAA